MSDVKELSKEGQKLTADLVVLIAKERRAAQIEVLEKLFFRDAYNNPEPIPVKHIQSEINKLRKVK